MIAGPYQQPMPQMPPMGIGMHQAAPTRIIKRPINDMERGFAIKAYKSLQNTVRVLAIVPLLLYIISYVMTVNGLMADTPLGIILGVFIIVISIMAIAMSVFMLSMRKKMAEVMREGMAIEVQGPAYRNRINRNVESWTVGPISMMANRALSGMIMEGASVSVLCIPKMKIAISINNMALGQGVRITCPPNLEMMATPTGQIPQPMQPTQPAFPQYYPQNQQQYQYYDPRMPQK